MALTSEESFSMLVSKSLDSLGYSYNIIKASQFTADIIQKNFNESLAHMLDEDFGYAAFLTGSKKEGISFFNRESDLDIMITFSIFKCSDHANGENIFKMQLWDAPSGYVMLQNRQNTGKIIEKKNEIYLCHYDEIFHGSYFKAYETKGPAVRITIPNCFLSINIGVPTQLRQTGPSLEHQHDLFKNEHPFTCDMVPAMKCECSYYLSKWCQRKRPYDHPPHYQIQEISKLDAHVVPVGCQNTEYSNYQWRICYTMTEIALIRSFNPTQYKVYVLLRMLSKEVIKYICSDVTSYIMKNVILWVSELYPLTMFQENNIPNCLVTCLHFLKCCVRERCLPNYMIPDRNLFFGKLDKENVMLSHLLKQLISERGMVIQHCGWVLPRIQMISKISIPQKLMDSSYLLHLLLSMEISKTVAIQPSKRSIISVTNSILHFIEKIFCCLQTMQKFPLLAVVKFCKRLIQYSLMQEINPVSDYRGIIQHALKLEKNITESIESDICQITKTFLTQKLQSMITDDDLPIMSFLINVFMNSEVFKCFIRSFLEKNADTFISGTPDEQKIRLQQLTHLTTNSNRFLNSHFGQEGSMQYLLQQ